jgi:enoyl-CoA hydratase/carnithine racemase
MGLALRCVPRADLRAEVAALAASIAAQPRAALLAVKEAVRAGLELPLSAGVEKELDLLLMLMAARGEATPEPVVKQTVV